jgi:ribosomal protein L32
MGLTGHRRTSSHKRRRASHFALVPPAISQDKAGNTHLSHRVAPGATEYRGITIHRKGLERKVQKMLAKTKSKATDTHDHNHDHDHDHADHQDTKN